MKRILIISFYFPPCNGTPAPRPYSWAKLFAERGYDVTVVTRHWTGVGNGWEDYIASTEIKEPYQEKESNFNIWWLPYKKISYPSNRIVAKWDTLSNLLRGNLEREVDTMQFYPFLKELMSKESFDLIISTAPPWNIAKLTATLRQEFKVPAIIDFRDYENDMTLNLNPTPSLGRKWEFNINRFFIMNWVKQVDLVCSASKPLGDYITKRTNKENIEILNGYESELLEKVLPLESYDKLTISVLGYLFQPQDLSVLFKGFQLFLEKNSSPKVYFNFIGGKAIESVALKIANNMPAEHINITPRVSPEEALQIGKTSHILFYTGWKNWTGVYSAKIFTYLGLKKNILIAPGDNDVIDGLIHKTNAGKIANTPEEFCDSLEEWYKEWLNTGTLEFKGDSQAVEEFSRKNQAERFLSLIEEKIFRQPALGKDELSIRNDKQALSFSKKT